MNKDIIFNYVIKNFKLYYDIPEFDKLDINYGFNKNSIIQINDEAINFFSNNKDVDIKNIFYKKVLNQDIPFLFGSFEELYSINGNKFQINFDLISNCFYFLSGWQEHVCTTKDSFGRFPFQSSIQCKLNIAYIPVVNYYFEILKEVIEKAYNFSIKTKLKNNKKNFTLLTHDIDTCQTAWLQGGYREFKKGKLLVPLKLLFKRLFNNDAWFNFNEIIDIEKKYNACSTFFFLPRKGKFKGFTNADYDVRRPSIKKAIQYLLNQNYEIGIHGSFGTHNNIKRFTEEIGFFDNKIICNRFHFLNFDINQTPFLLEKSGIKYDCSLGFAENIGFRNSCCFPFFLFDFINKSTSDVIEMPLIVMDASLQNKKYMNIEKSKIIPEIKIIIEQINKFNGCFSLLWHNTHFSEYKYGGWKEIYIELMELCNQNNCLFTNGKGIYEVIRNK